METAVGASTTVSIRYRLPFRTTGSLTHKYLLYLQRQSGSRIQHYDISVRTPDSTKVLWSYPAIPLDSGPVLRWEADPWTRDQTLGILLKRSVNSKITSTKSQISTKLKIIDKAFGNWILGFI